MEISHDLAPAREPRYAAWAWLALLVVALHLTIGHRLRVSQWCVNPASNAAFEEALQWQKGRLALEQNDYEVARADGRRYNVVGTAFVILSVIGTNVSRALGGPPDEFPPALYVLFTAGALVLAAFLSFRAVMKSSAWATLFSFNLIACTSVLPVLVLCGGRQGGSIYFIDHVLAVAGLLLFAADLLGPKRIWPAAIGLAPAAWSRPMTALYVLPLLAIAYRQRRAASPAPAGSTPRKRPFATALVATAIIVGLPAILNTLKFGSPLDTGYGRLYEGRTDPIGRRGRDASFSLRYAEEGAWAMNLAFPRPDLRRYALYLDCAGIDGAGIWLTCPILLGVFLTVRKWARDPIRRALMLGTLPVIFGVLCYHTTGAQDAGHYRYALDFVPIWLLCIAPLLTTRPRASFVWAATAYSAVYFSLLP